MFGIRICEFGQKLKIVWDQDFYISKGFNFFWMQELVLSTWGEGFGQPCLDPLGLAIHTYLAFSKVHEDVRLEVVNSRRSMGNPVLRDAGTRVSGMSNIISHLKQYRYDTHCLNPIGKVASISIRTYRRESGQTLSPFPFS